MTNRLRLGGALLSLPLLATGIPHSYAADEDQLATMGDLRGGAAEERRRAREAELEAIRRSIEVSERRQTALREEMEGLERDRASLSGELVATAQRLRETEENVRAIEERLEELHARSDTIRFELSERRSVMAEVLMALQRMGGTPPPAILSRPEDALAAIRGSILASSVLPDIRVEAEALAANLTELASVSERIEADRASLEARYAALGEERERISLLVDARKAQREQTEATLEVERAKAAELASRAGSLQSLIQTLESELAAAAEAAQEAKETARKTARADREEAERRISNTSRIAPAVHFDDARGLLMRPVSGEQVAGFGEPDGLGGESQGLSLATQPGTPVLAPADGWVVYAGPFRSYGQVLILNAGDGYHIVLAGMERIDAALGQFVLGGEPVATMGATRLASLGEVEHTSAQPILYVEFRKDGTAIDSAPWWAPTESEVNG